MRKVPAFRLWIGHVGDARAPRVIHDVGIEAMVDLAGNEMAITPSRELLYCRYPLVDGSGNPSWMIRGAIETVTLLLQSNVPVLVYCSAGMSRSVAVTAAAIAGYQNRSFESALKDLAQDGPADVSAALVLDIQRHCTNS